MLQIASVNINVHTHFIMLSNNFIVLVLSTRMYFLGITSFKKKIPKCCEALLQESSDFKNFEHTNEVK